MSLTLPGARHLFSHVQLVLAKKIKSRVHLGQGVHNTLVDFRWLLADIKNYLTHIAELSLLLGLAEGHHDASSKGAGGRVWFLDKHLQSRQDFDRLLVL